MEIFQNLRQPNLVNEFDNKLIKDFTLLIHGFDFNKIVLVQSLPGPKGKFGNCSINCREKVQQFGGEIVYGIQIDIDDNNIYGTFHCIWKYNNKLFDVTDPEFEHEHNKNNIVFIPADKSQHFTIRKDTGDFYMFPKPLIHIYNQEIFSKFILNHLFMVV